MLKRTPPPKGKKCISEHLFQNSLKELYPDTLEGVRASLVVTASPITTPFKKPNHLTEKILDSLLLTN